MSVSPYPSPHPLGPFAALAAKLPERGRTLHAFLVLGCLFALVVVFGKLLEKGGGAGMVLIQGAMLLLGLMMFWLLCLTQWRRVVDFAYKIGKLPDHIPGVWRMFLLPYPKADVDEMMRRGRLAELLTLPAIFIMFFGLLLAVMLRPGA